VLCAIGYSGVPVDVTKVGVVFRSKAGSVELCRGGAGVPFSEELASQVLHETEIEILVSLGDGAAAATAWGCDLSYEYVRINGD
jgi:glutamate N-acetyltransferase/amino-acid N-acetyltransferase